MPRSGNHSDARYKSGRPTTEQGIDALLTRLERHVTRPEQRLAALDTPDGPAGDQP